MKKWIVRIGVLIVATVAVLLVYAAAFVPAEYKITRSITINAPASVVFPWVNEPKKMNSWSPWLKLDPKVQVTYSGPEGGVDAASSWDGDMNVGAGTITITNSGPPFLVRMRLDYLRPMKGTSTTDFSLKQMGDVTSVDWIISGKNNLLSRVFCIFMNMEKMIGGEFETGLAALKTTVEAGNK